MSRYETIINNNIATLIDGDNLLSRLSTDQYQQGFKPAFHSTVGAHYRHFLEHYQCFFEQLKSGSFCYDTRQREQRLEQDKSYAQEKTAKIIMALKKLSTDDFTKNYTIGDDQTIEPVATSLERELLFLQSHTVHHYALIAAIARCIGVDTDDDFGVAIATKTFQKQLASNKNDGREGKQCAH